MMSSQAPADAVVDRGNPIGPPIEAANKGVAWLVGGVVILASAFLVAALAGALFAFIATLIIAAVVIVGVLFLTETPESLQEGLDKAAENWEKFKAHFETWKAQVIQLAAERASAALTRSASDE